MESSAENDQRVMSIATMAMRQEPAERESYLRLACEDDRELYREVSEIVFEEERMGNFLQQPMIAFQEFPNPFEPCQVVCQRFEIIRKIGEGGMGVVYEAYDRKRGLRIAIKSAKPGFQRLLSPELEGALTVRHPNVCRVNEIHTALTEHGEVDFLTMELLEGQTLSARLKDGRIPEREALDIARQLCAGLAEAHRSGVIHRDLKSANIVLSSDTKGHLRAVITDFGLAGAPLESDGVCGTPGYMAPELWNGKQSSKASDIYSLGVILYETVSGRRPFQSESAEEQIVGRPAAPSAFTRILRSRWDRAILPCLDPSPDARPADATRILARLEKRPLRTAPLFAVPLLLLASLIFPVVREWIWPSPNVRLAVLPAVVTGDSAQMVGGWLQDVADRVGHMRAAHRTVAVIPPQEVQSMQVQTPEQAGQLLHATHALETIISREGSEFVTRVSVIDLDTKVHLRDFSARYSADTVGMAPAALAGEVSLALRLRSATPVPEAVSSDAVQLYDRGLYFLGRDDESYAEAIPMFQQAAQLDGHSPLPWAGLAEAQINKYKATKQREALDEAQNSVRAAESLNPDSARVRLVAGLLNKTAGRTDKALDDYRRAQDLEPANVETFLRIASVYDEMDEPGKAVENYHKAITLEPGYYDPYQELGVFYYYRGNYPEAVEQFKKAIECAPGLYDAYTNLGAALNYLGRDTEAQQALMASIKIKETPRALNSLGAIHAYRHQDSEAANYYERAIGINPRNYIYLLNLADSYRRVGRVRDAKTSYRKGMSLALTELNDNARNGLTRAYVAYFAARLGDRNRAKQETEQALGLSPGDSMVARKAVLTYVALGETGRAVEILRGTPAEVIRELDRHPDLAAFRQDLRFQQLAGMH
jgi:tetratricopeptide (TPR) repeat protein